MIRSMRAAILVEQRAPLVVDEVQLPEALGVGQVLVKLHFAGICGSQLGEIDGVKGPDPHLPHLLGHEGSGTVLELGPGVTQVEPGDRVVLHWRPGPGIEALPPRYRWRERSLSAGRVTAWNEHAVVSENRITTIPEGVPLDLAALLGCAVTTGLGAVTRDGRLEPGESCVVLGAGGVGLCAVQAAGLVSGYPIVAVDRFVTKLDLARKLGASDGVRADEGVDVEAQVREVVGAAGADLVIETTGHPALIRLAYELAQAQGRVVLVGVPPADQPAVLPTLPLHLGKRLTGSHGGAARPERDVPRCLRLAAAGRLDLAALVTDRVGLGDIDDAVARQRRGEIAGRCLVELDTSS